MKIEEPFAIGSNTFNASLWKRRMEAFLSAWRMARAPHRSQRPVPPDGTTLTREEWQIWLRILRVAEPVSPRDQLDGLKTYARFAGLSIEELERDKAILIIGDQVAFRMRPQAGAITGYSWSLLVSPERADAKPDLVHAILQKRFRTVTIPAASILASGSWENCTDSLFPLIADAVAAETPEALSRLWKLALALSLQLRFLAQLPASMAQVLADLLGKELLDAVDRVDVVTDAKLTLFASGSEGSLAPAVARPLPTPQSRLSELLEAEQFLDHAEHSIADGYYETVADAFARVAETRALGKVLNRLPAGRALFAAFDAIRYSRPELIASYVDDPEFHAAGAFALLQLRLQQEQLPQAFRLNMSEEWLKVHTLGRELLLLAYRTDDWASLATLGVRDEAEAMRRRHYGVAPFERDSLPYDGAELWNRVVTDPDRSERYVQVLETYFRERAQRSDAAFVFALRMLSVLRGSGQTGLATRLAAAIVDGYADGLALDITTKAVPRLLCAYGELLAGLRESLDPNGDSWRKFLRPFDRKAYLDAARAEVSIAASSWTINPIYDVPNIFRAHAETLTALASASNQPDEVLAAVLELYEADITSGLTLEAFSWSALARITGPAGTPAVEALFVRIGRLLGLDPSARRLDAFLRSEPPAHILAYVAIGLGPSHAAVEAIRSKLRNQINDLLADADGIDLGHCLELSSALQHAAMPRDSERLARRALEIIDARPQQRRDFAIAARAQLAGALAQQELWAELLAFEPQGNVMVVSPPAQFIENMRALALIESKRFTEAEALMRAVLDANPRNTVALVNLTALYLRASDWRRAVEASVLAKPLLSGDDLDRLLANEAVAREQLGDTYGAANVLENLSEGARKRDVVVEALQRLQRGDRDVPPTTPEVTTFDSPDESVDIAIVTALLDEYTAVRRHFPEARDVPAAIGRAENFYGWALDEIKKSDNSGRYKIVLAWTGGAGNIDAFDATMRTIERWNPRVVLFCGIAGGFKRDGLVQGDIVLSERIWHYDRGKVVDGAYEARHRDFPTHHGLLTSARVFSSTSQSWTNCRVVPPSPDHVPKCLAGLIGSGDKVLDDQRPAFVQAVLKARPELQAVEMEGAGAAAAVQKAQEQLRSVAFLMVRGISDMPKEAADAAGAGTQERDNWKPYASAIAAQFIVSWVAAANWPFVTRASEALEASTMRLSTPGQPGSATDRR